MDPAQEPACSVNLQVPYPRPGYLAVKIRKSRPSQTKQEALYKIHLKSQKKANYLMKVVFLEKSQTCRSPVEDSLAKKKKAVKGHPYSRQSLPLSNQKMNKKSFSAPILQIPKISMRKSLKAKDYYFQVLYSAPYLRPRCLYSLQLSLKKR